MQDAAVSLNGLSPRPHNPYCGFELMNGAAARPRCSGSRQNARAGWDVVNLDGEIAPRARRVSVMPVASRGEIGIEIHNSCG
jgi:hypothetical protein